VEPIDVSVCPRFHHAVELIGARWSGAIVSSLMRGAVRYGDIRDAIPGLSDTMLAQRLKALEAEGVVTRSAAPVEYRLTDKGAALAPVVAAVETWAHDWLPASDSEKAA
jgi:DNA-binding HxlR family transcriptional regulator